MRVSGRLEADCTGPEGLPEDLGTPETRPGPTDSASSVVLPAPPRVAYFPDSFHEVNGVAHTSRHFEAFARRRGLPFLCVRAGSGTPMLVEEGSVWTLELPRGALSFPLEKDLRYDPAFVR